MSLRCALPGCARFLASQDAVRFEIRKAGNTPSCILYHPHCAMAAAAALKRDAQSAMDAVWAERNGMDRHTRIMVERARDRLASPEERGGPS